MPSKVGFITAVDVAPTEALVVRTPRERIQIYVTPSGRYVRVWVGDEQHQPGRVAFLEGYVDDLIREVVELRRERDELAKQRDELLPWALEATTGAWFGGPQGGRSGAELHAAITAGEFGEVA